MAQVKITGISVYKNGGWHRLNAIAGQDHIGYLRTHNDWYVPWPPTDGIFHNGSWYIMNTSGGGTTPPPEPTLTTNNLTIRRLDWLSSSGWKFGFRSEWRYPVNSNIVGDFKLKSANDKELSMEFGFAKGGVPYQDYKSNEDIGNYTFVSGTIIPAKDTKYEYGFAQKKDDIIT